MKKVSRRGVMAGTAALAAGSLPVRVSAAPEPQKITSALVEAAKKEGKLSWYTSVDLPLAERVAKAFEAAYPGVTMKVERSGAERIFQRIGQEAQSRISNCDVVNSSDAAHLIVWKRANMLASWLPEEVAQHFPKEHYDPDGMFASWRVSLCPIGYNPTLVKAEDAPKGFMDLLDPRWMGKIATQQLSRDLGWSWFEKLAKQKVMQVQSATEPAKKVTSGERAVAADGNEYVLQGLKDRGEPIEEVYAVEGTPLVTGPSGIMAAAPNPNAARLFYAWSMSAEAQQLNIDVGALRSVHDGTRDRPGRRKLSDIKTLREDAAAVADQAEAIKARYLKIFRV